MLSTMELNTLKESISKCKTPELISNSTQVFIRQRNREEIDCGTLNEHKFQYNNPIKYFIPAKKKIL